MINGMDIYTKEYLKNLCDSFLLQIFLDEEVDTDLIGKIMDAFDNNKNFYKMFIDNILNEKKEKKNIFYIFSNYQNMHHLAHIFLNISINIDSTNNPFYDLNFAIIYISERTYFLDEKTEYKFYLCSLLSKNKLYSRKSFWFDLIELKLVRRIEDNIKKISSKNFYFI